MRTNPRARRLSGIGVLLLGGLGLSGCAIAGSGSNDAAAESIADMEPVTITLGDSLAPDDSWGKASTEFFTAVEEQTDGKVTFETYWSGSLVPGPEALEGIGSGVADMATLTTSWFPEELPVSNFLHDAAGIAGTSFPEGLITGTAATTAMYTTNQDLIDEYAEQNLVVLGGGYSSRYSILCTEEIGDVEEAEGTLVRTGGPAQARDVEAMGMTPVPIAYAEVYEAVQRGVADCALLHPNTYIDSGLWEIAPHFYQLDVSGLPGQLFIMNKTTLESLPNEVQEIFRAEGQRWAANVMSNISDNYVQFATEGVEDHGVEFHDVASFNERMDVFHEEWTASLPDAAPDAVSDPDQFIEEWRDELSAWDQLLIQEFALEPVPQEDGKTIREAFIASGEVDYAAIGDRMIELLKDRN